ncbi:MAG: zf-HC2 domain-containing protein [bacterium]
MIDCSQFEDLYPLWQSGEISDEVKEELERHQKECPFCRYYEPSVNQIRTQLFSKIPLYSPSSDFEIRLKRRLASSERPTVDNRKERWSISWPVIGVGLLTGLAAGLFWVIPQANHPVNVNTPLPTPSFQENASQVAEVAGETLKNDSGKVTNNDTTRSPFPYGTERHTQIVSSPRQ